MNEPTRKWQPASETAVNAFMAATTGMSGAEPRKMFGYACVFTGGNMFSGLHEVGVVIRLPEDARAEFIRQYDSPIFEPMPGRKMREYVVVPDVLLNAPEDLRAWIERARDYAASLPVKVAKPKVAKVGKR
jgi:TfoX/Sxy family transcriptional regulator of competence genes